MSYRYPALRDSGLVGQRRFNDVSAILDCKDTKNFEKKYSLSEKTSKKGRIIWKYRELYVSLQHERKMIPPAEMKE